jgi:hypothetical protein
MAVGDNQGTVYTGNEGHQRAFIFGNPTTKPQEDLINLALKKEGDKVKIAEAQAKKQQATKENLAKKMQDMPEHFYAHDPEIKEQQEKILKIGADIMSNGADPFTGTDPLSLEFRKQFTRHEKMAEYSKQIKSLFEADRNSFNPDKFTLDSYNTRMDFYPTVKLNKAVDEGLLPPNLVPKNPVFELQKTYGDLAQKVGMNNKDPQPQDLDQAINIMMTDPASKDFVPTINAAMNKLSPEDKKQLEEQAKGQNITPQQLLARNQFQTYFRKEPLDLNKVIDDSMPTGDVRSSKNSQEDMSGVTIGNSSKTDVLAPEKALKHAESQLVLQPQLYEAILKGGGKNEDGTPITDEKQAAKWLANVYQTRYKTIRESERTTSRESGAGDGTGLGEKEAKRDSDMWRSFLTRTENSETIPYLEQLEKKHGWTRAQAMTHLQKQAAEFMNGTKTANGQTINGASVILPGETATIVQKDPLTGQDTEIGVSDPHIKLDIGTEGSEDVKSIVDGKEVTTKKKVFIPSNNEFFSVNPNSPTYRQKSSLDTHWKQAVKSRGKRFEDIIKGGILEDVTEVPKGITVNNAQDAVPEKGIWNKGKNNSKNTTTNNSNPAILD